ncbi:AAA family ATPase [Vibrio alginolyticus]|uniref:AAA family ATPase n=1 Tax=Vibrio alginolyticus TaxID=663 RepID=UPI001BD23169|nr:AAA family ATPase [Vibrio alginolyticus]MBT0111950.1 AAA family ATPase [Vibrio alginolyticus]
MSNASNKTSFYITEISATDHPFIKQNNINFAIPDGSKKDIIITGRNGFGKSTLLTAIRGLISQLWAKRNSVNQFFVQQTAQRKAHLQRKQKFESLSNPTIQEQLNFNNQCVSVAQHGFLLDAKINDISSIHEAEHVLGYFEAKRMTQLQKPNNITAPNVGKDAIGNNTSGQKFLAHLVNRRSQLAFANEEGELEEAQQIRTWFDNLDGLFSLVFEKPVKLKFIRDQLDFVIQANDGEIIDIKKLSDGYSAIISIVTEIITRMEAISFGRLDIGGIVLIDEIETHLHVALQKKILPFLNTMFPNIQFIVTTHSPFVLASANNALIYDIATGKQMDSEDEIWKYGFDDIVEGYFDTDSHSDDLEMKVDEFEKLSANVSQHSVDETRRFILLKNELEDAPTFKLPHIELRLRQLGLKKG